MAYPLEDKLVVGISSRALFDLDDAHHLFAEQGLDAYREYQAKNEDVPLKPGTGFPLVKALLGINDLLKERAVEVIIISRNDGDSGLRIWNSIQSVGLDISRGSFAGGTDAHRYLEAYCCKLFLSADEDDVRNVIKSGCAAGLVFQPADKFEPRQGELRIAFDADAVIFGPSSERVYQEQGLTVYMKHETELANTPLEAGPFKPFLQLIATIQSRFGEKDCPIRTAVVTARNAPAHKRAIQTLREWKIRVNEMHFLGGVAKAGILRAFRPHIFFDDQKTNLEPSASEIPSAQVCGVYELPERKPAGKVLEAGIPARENLSEK